MTGGRERQGDRDGGRKREREGGRVEERWKEGGTGPNVLASDHV